jgi:RimJ/RimL family protein N-acetyltransferase
MAHYRQTRFKDIKKLAPRLRVQDQHEVMASHGLYPYEALVHCFETSDECNTIIDDSGEIIGLFGFNEVAEGLLASPWLLGSDKIKTIGRDVIRVSNQWVRELNKNYSVLYNYVDQHNEVAIRWLKSLGFTFVRLIPEHGVGKKPFYEFVRINESCAPQH